MAATIQKPARLTLTTAIVVALAAVAGTVAYRTHGQPQQPDVYQLAFSDQLSNCGNDAECWKVEATRMQQVARYYQTHAPASREPNREALSRHAQRYPFRLCKTQVILDKMAASGYT